MLQAIKQLEMGEMITLTYNLGEADAFLALHSKLKKNPHIQAFAKSRNRPIFVTKVVLQIYEDFLDFFNYMKFYRLFDVAFWFSL